MMYKKRLEPSNPPELKSIYDNDLEKSVFGNANEKKDNVYQDKNNEETLEMKGQDKSNEETLEMKGQDKSNEGIEGQDKNNEETLEMKGQDKSNEETIDQYNTLDAEEEDSDGSSITFNRIKKKVVRKYIFLKNKIKTSSVDYKLDLINDAVNKINDAVNKINGRINMLEIKVNNLELDINKNKNELMEHDRLTSIEMTNINDKLNNANIIILD